MTQSSGRMAQVLISAIAAIARETAAPSVQAVYRDFKDKIASFFGSDNDILDVVNRLEKKPGSKGLQQQVAEELECLDSRRYQQLVEAFRPLLKKGDNVDIDAGGDVAFAKDQAVAVIIKQVTVNQNGESAVDCLHKYLQRLVSDSSYLPWANLDENYADPTCGEGLTLLDVYTALDTTSVERLDCEDAVRCHLNGLSDSRRVSAQEMVDTYSRLVLLGDPGSGKSTLLNYLTHVLAHAGLANTEYWLRRLEQSGPWSHGVMLPVRIVLKDFADSLPADRYPGQSSHLLLDFLECNIAPAGFWRILNLILQNRQAKVPCLIMLDGLDEVPEACRGIVLRSIGAFAAQFDWHHYVVTCRVYAYAGQGCQLGGFHSATLMPFSDEQIERFISAWYKVLGKRGRFAERDATERAQTLQKAATRSDLIGLAERPLLMTVMALLNTYRGRLPEDRVELYQWTVDLLMHRWESRHTGEKGILELLAVPGLKMNDLEAGFHAVAFDIHAGGGADDGLGEIREGELRERLAQYLNQDWNKAGEFVTYIHDRAGLLIRHKPKAYTFPHRTFQEFLAACHLVSVADYPLDSARLLCNNLDRWRIVFILAAGFAARTHRLGLAVASISALYTYCHDSVECPGQTMDHLAVVAGEALLEIGLVGINREPTGRDVRGRVQQWLMKAFENDVPLTDHQRVETGNVLGRLGDPRFDPARCYLPDDDQLGFVDIPEGPFKMGSNKKIDAKAHKNELPQHPVHLSAFKMARFPVTVSQYRAFAKETGRELDETWKRYNRYDNHPVVMVSWEDAMAYCQWLTEKPFIRGTVTLPTEAQWEKAARGGDGRIYPWGDTEDPSRANYGDSAIGGTSPVGCFPGGKSPFEILDLSGNVFEWCLDDTREYNDKPVKDPIGEGPSRVLRGGAWYFTAEYCRTAVRNRSLPDFRYDNIGFRLVCLPGQQGEPGQSSQPAE